MLYNQGKTAVDIFNGDFECEKICLLREVDQ